MCSIFIYSQNSYQKNFYELNKEINLIQKKLKDNKLTIDLMNEKFEIVKSLNRLGEETLQASLDGEINEELGDLINYACEIGREKINFLESYKKYNNQFLFTKI